MYVVCLKLVQSMVVRVPFGNCETRCVVRKPSVKATRMVCFGTLVEVTPMIRQNVVCTFIATQVCAAVVGFGFTYRYRQELPERQKESKR